MRFKTTPFPHQLADLEASKDRVACGYFHEPGLGKTKLAIDGAVHLLDNKKVNAVLVVAPNGVHRNWASREMPKHTPQDILDASTIFCWSTASASTKRHAGQAERLLATTTTATANIPWLFVSYDALMTEACVAYVRRFFKRYDALFIADESHFVKNPGAARTKRCLAASLHAPYRRILTGTPIDKSPFDAYAQLKFLSQDVWRSIGCDNFLAFKNHFGTWEQGFNRGTGQQYRSLTGFKNLGVLQRILSEWGYRRTKDILDLPPKLYTRRYFTLGPKARKAYDALSTDYLAELSGGVLTAELTISRMVRFQQATSGYLPTDEDATKVALDLPNPRIGALLDCLLELAPSSRKAIVWAKYDEDCTRLAEAFEKEAISFVRYDGSVTAEQRHANLERFQSDPGVRVFLSKTSVGGTGLTIVEASAHIFYNVSFGRYGERRQAEDRSHRPGQKAENVLYVDIVAEDTIDEHILENLLESHDIATFLNRDTVRTWF